MNQATVIEVLKCHGAAWRKTGATGLFMFGPGARSTERTDSDLDLVIDYTAANDACVLVHESRGEEVRR